LLIPNQIINFEQNATMNTMNYNDVFELSFEQSTICNALVDLDGRIIRANEAYLQMVGYTSDEVVNEHITKFAPEEEAEKERHILLDLLAKKLQSTVYESVRLHKSGTIVFVSVKAIVIYNKQNEPTCILKKIEDLTQMMRLESEMRKKHFYLETLMNEIPINIYFKDAESRFLLASKKMVEIFGCTHFDEMEGKTDFDFFTGEHANQAYEDEKLIINTGKTLIQEEKETWPDGTVTYVLTTKMPLKDSFGNIVGTYGLSNDITKQKIAEEALKKAKTELEEKNNLLNETLNELNKTQNQLVFAEKMAALGSLIGGIAHEINTPLGAIQASSSNIMEVVSKIYEDLPWLISHATPEEIAWLFDLLNSADARDISVFSREERQKKRNLERIFEENGIENASKMADTLTSLRIDKDTDTYLRFVKMENAPRLLAVLKVIFSLKRNTNNITISVDKASKVVKALKSYVHKNPAGEFEATDLTETINTVLILNSNSLKHNKIQVTTKFTPVPQVFCMQDELCQVWTNIIVNAIQAMGENGEMEIGIEPMGPDYVKIWFKDTGGGIPVQYRDKIFDPYFTTKKKGEGTGIGLDLSSQIIKKHNGKIYFETEDGVGTTFIIELPVNLNNII